MATSFGEAMIQSEVALTLVIQSEGTELTLLLLYRHRNVQTTAI